MFWYFRGWTLDRSVGSLGRLSRGSRWLPIETRASLTIRLQASSLILHMLKVADKTTVADRIGECGDFPSRGCQHRFFTGKWRLVPKHKPCNRDRNFEIWIFFVKFRASARGTLTNEGAQVLLQQDTRDGS
jgi:hypothetical protein